MITIRYWLEQLFKCDFERAYFDNIVFNPEMINILFDNDKTISPQFNILNPTLYTRNKTFENVLKFYLNHLSNSEYIEINLDSVDITEKRTEILFNILKNEGNKLKRICVSSYELTNLYDLILEVSRLQIQIKSFKSFTNTNQLCLNHLISETLQINFLSDRADINNYKNILFKILISGEKFKNVYLNFAKFPENLDCAINVPMLYDQIAEYIATSERIYKNGASYFD
uniref:Uncharacterized protein n=1 Tax=Meloidogyne enterolobii TaxID=390850 RepID=A0A6V7XL27_MELEN|nr:unnamed protein product [Meloidogyne enterolobii]